MNIPIIGYSLSIGIHNILVKTATIQTLAVIDHFLMYSQKMNLYSLEYKLKTIKQYCKQSFSEAYFFNRRLTYYKK